MAAQQNEARVVIGLDFGTTFSGVAYCDKSNASVSDIHLIQRWPGVNRVNNNEKVPSRIAYLDPTPGKPNGDILWGNMIKHKVKVPVHACMKLSLDEKQKGSNQLSILMALLTSNFQGLDVEDLEGLMDGSDGPPAYPGKDAVDLSADYLSKIRETAYAEMSKRYGEVMFSTMRRELVVTVPAVWSERAKDKTMKAVSRAGWGADGMKISMIAEPEAAAIYTLRGMREGVTKEDIQVGDVFVLCDAGGGTVDLISYKITQVSPVFNVEEAAIGSGDKCGATYIEKEFLSWLEDWIGQERFKRIPPEMTRHGSEMINMFETNKLQFSGTDDEMTVRLPSVVGIGDDEDLNIEDNSLAITNAQMKKFFDPCVNRTLELIDGQVAAVMKAGLGKPKMVFVVGGFGQNGYLYSRIQEYCDARNIQTRQPMFPWSAVARGAVCRGLETAQGGLVAVRLARKSYGTPVSVMWNPLRHDPADMHIDEYTGMKMAKGQMRWLCDKGDRLPESAPKTMSIEVSAHFNYSEERTIGALLAGCANDVPCTRFADDDVKVICRVRADFSDIPVQRFPKSRNPKTGEEYFEVEFKLEAHFKGSGEIVWRMLYKGQEWGSTTVTYED
ncbi:Fc.00g028360.m01.CDS01 [Cosmosporella sp. VM-42]